jgi:predicted phage baseplate assembly protein
MVRDAAGSGRQPQLLSSRRADTLRELLQRAAAFTPEWTNHGNEDAGYALARLFAEMSEPVIQRLNRLPEKTFVEFLRAAGVSVLPRQSARAVLTFAVDGDAPAPVLVPEGFEVSVPASDGSGDTITFETDRTLHAAPLAIVAAFRKTGALPEEIDLAASLADNAPGWLPFGPRPRAGNELLIGFAGSVAARPNISLAFELAANEGAPAPAARGAGVANAFPSALLRWDVLDGASFESAALVRDDTRGLTQNGIVELRVPERWRAGTPLNVDRDDASFWMRVRIVHGEFAKPPAVRSVQVNAVEATAVRTIRNEVLEYAPDSDRQRMLLSQTPVLPDSLDLVVIERGVDQDTPVAWASTASLALHGPEDRVYVLDGERGELSFGDGVHGARLPRGFRHVIARRYQVGGGVGGRVQAQATFDLVNSVPFITGVTNPMAASGGRNVEARSDTMQRGPQQIRARGRAVTPADFALLAQQVPGSDVARAYAMAGRDLRFPGAAVPGTVSVLLVSSDRGASPPIPDAGTLEQVAAWLTAKVAPAGIQVVAGAPRFVFIGVRAAVVLDARADTGPTIALALQNLEDFLHPLRGGEDREGWPFGGAVRYQALVRMLLDRTPGLVAVSRLNLVTDGLMRGHCLDFALGAGALIWPVGHEVIPATEEPRR